MELGNKTKAKIREGKPVVGASVSLESPVANKIMGQAGFDFLLIDAQHNPIGVESLDRLISGLLPTESEIIVRVLWNDGPLINQALDMGADGVIIPMVNTREQAEGAVAASKYRPDGTRSWSPLRPERYGGPEAYARVANEELLVLPQVETAEAVENLDDILQVDGIDAIMVGPTDLAISLGHPPRIGVPEVDEVIAHVLARCRSFDVPFGIFTNALETAEHWLTSGGQIAIAVGDVGLLTEGAARAAGEIAEMLRRLQAGA